LSALATAAKPLENAGALALLGLAEAFTAVLSDLFLSSTADSSAARGGDVGNLLKFRAGAGVGVGGGCGGKSSLLGFLLGGVTA